MTPDLALALGRFPGVPENARIVHAAGRKAVPAAGASDYLDQVGGTAVGYLFSARDLDPNVRFTAQLVALGIGVHAYDRTLFTELNVGAGASQAIAAALALAAPTPFTELMLEAAAVGVNVDDGGAPLIHQQLGANTPFYLRNGVLPTAWRVTNTTGAGINVRILLSQRDAAILSDLTVQVAFRPVAAAGTVHSGMDRLLSLGDDGPRTPQPITDAGLPVLHTLQASGEALRFQPTEALGVKVSQVGGGRLTTACTVTAHAILAVWDD